MAGGLLYRLQFQIFRNIPFPVEYPVNVHPFVIVVYLVERQIVLDNNPAIVLVPFIGLVHPWIMARVVKSLVQGLKKSANGSGVEL
jgi:hypothetical protein